MQEIKLSIIIPIYNKEKYIEKCIESLLLNGVNYEILLINDGSTDNSLLICEKLKNKYIEYNIYVFSQKNKGVSNARNFGLSQANGKYILFMDADDYVDSKELMKSLNILDEYHPDILFSNVKKVDENGSLICENKFPHKGYYKQFKDLIPSFLNVQLNKGLYGCVSNKIFKRSISEINNILFDENISLAEDLDFYLDIYEKIEDCYYFDSSYLYYLQDADNSSTKKQFIKEPDYCIQANILYKEYMFLSSYRIKNIDILKSRINDYIIFYLKYNYISNTQEYKIERLLNSQLMSIIDYKNRKSYDYILLKLLYYNHMKTLYIILLIYKFIRKIYHKLTR